MAQGTTKKTGLIIVILIGVVLVSALGYFVNLYLEEKQKNEDYVVKIEDLDVEINELEEDLIEMEDDINRKDLEIEEKDALLAQKEDELAKKQAYINKLYQQGKISEEKAAQLQEKVDQLNYYIKKYQAEIEELKEQVGYLTSQNQELGTKVDSLENFALETEKKNLLYETKLEAAAILKTYNFKFYRVKSSGKEIEETAFKDRKLDHLKVCFDIMENNVAKPGQRDVFIQIQNPNGTVHTDGKSGSFKAEGKEMTYTKKATINYNNATQKVCVDYMKSEGEEFMEGTQKVLVFVDGYKIGTGSFEIE